jgi:tellurite resistance protein TerC
VDVPHHPWFFWIAFNVFILTMLVLDLCVFHRHARVIKFKEALGWTGFWIALAAAFGVLLYFWHGPGRTLEFVTGYVIEESLSVDNLFVFLLVFRYFKVPAQYQHKVLFWGIVGALLMRILFIGTGVTLIRRFEWIIYLFGIFLVYAGAKLLRSEEIEIQPEHNQVLKLFRRRVRVTPDYVGGHFSMKRGGLRYFTPLAVVLLVVETTDVAFATDSIPAVLAITRDPFIVYTSNVFAILGLRSLYFALAGMMEVFHYLHYGLATILIFVGVKMLVARYFPIPVGAALAVIAVVLGLSVAASLLFPKRAKAPDPDETR